MGSELDDKIKNVFNFIRLFKMGNWLGKKRRSETTSSGKYQ